MDFMNSVKIRVSGWRMFIAGDISFLDALNKTLPTRWQPKSAPGKRTVKLFNKPFVVPDGIIPIYISLVSEIVHSNQYHVELIKDGATVVDAGANMGIFSIYVARKYPNAIVYAFEPAPDTFISLKENTKYYPNIKVFNIGLGNANQNASMVMTGWSIGSYIGPGTVPVAIRKLDDVGIKQKVDFIKIDTEGYEAPILRGAIATIKRSQPIIAMSAYHHVGDKTELPKLLNTIAPYRCELRNDFEEDLVCTPRMVTRKKSAH